MRRHRLLERGDTGGGGERSPGRGQRGFSGGIGAGAGQSLDEGHELAGVGVDDLGGDGVDDHRIPVVLRLRLRRVLVVRWRRYRWLLDLARLSAYPERSRPWALQLSPRRRSGFRGIHGWD
ncbi:hypothetical protein C4D60_Mb06t13620 [Musa balbisiana]|uniref:Uncharacterized protein n=1 Tax=Musa balbisiana TaxID=52838 RepID=A0A4S8IMY6_MUSBA|nr:hypothetical protein C4D60_Mb06t13620 [Musa balbisiana]